MGLAKEGKLFESDTLSADRYPKLAHAGLHEQLVPVIGDKTLNVVVRRIAIELAQAAGERRVLESLVAVALDPLDEPSVRVRAVMTVVRLGTRADRRQFRPLITDSEVTGVTDDLRGVILGAIWPDDLSSEELFAALPSPEEEHHIGFYHFFLRSQLLETIGEVDLLPALRWLEASASDQPDSALEPVQSAVLQHALARCEQQDICRALAKVLWTLLRKFSPLMEWRPPKDGFLTLPQHVRRRLLIEVARLVETPENSAGHIAVSRLPLLDPLRDLDFLLDEFSRCREHPLRETIGELASRLVHLNSPREHIEEILNRSGLSALNRDTALASHFRWLVDPVMLDSPEASRARETLRAQKQFLERPQAQKLEPPPGVRIRLILERIEDGKPEWWPTLVLQLSLKEDSMSYGMVGARVLDQPGWIGADESTRDRIARAALAYLNSFQPPDHIKSIVNQWNTSDEGPLSALVVLKAQQPALYDGIDSPTRGRLFSTLLCVPWDNSQALEQAFQDAYRANAMEGDAQACARIRLASQGAYSPGILDKLELIWSPTLDNAAHAVLEESQVSNEGFRDLLRRLLRRDCDSGIALALKLYQSPPRAELAPVVLSLLMVHDLSGLWGQLWPLLTSDDTLARLALLEPPAGDKTLFEQLKLLSAEQIGLLYTRLEALFPRAEDPQLSGLVTPRHRIAQLREQLLLVLSRLGSFDACRVIEQLSAAQPQSLELKYVLAEAIKVARAATWETPTVEWFAQLLASPERRLVRNARELMEVVLATLTTIQERLKGSNQPVAQYWDEREGDKRPKSEDRMSDNVREYLDLMLHRQGVVVNREVEVRNLRGKGVGQRTDLLISAGSGDSGEISEIVETVIECKGCWNSGLFTNMRTQLRDQYLTGFSRRTGIYLVGWFLGEAWSEQDPRKAAAAALIGSREIEDLRLELAEKARALSGETEITSVVLDLSLR